MKKPLQVRQGDVLITRIAKIPADVALRARDRGRVILAYGEVTGHAHEITDAEVVKAFLADLNDKTYLSIPHTVPEVDSWRVRSKNGDGFVPAYEPIGRVRQLGDVVGRELVHGVVLTHQEHIHLVIPAGDYMVGGQDVPTQREYSPEAIRNVAD